MSPPLPVVPRSSTPATSFPNLDRVEGRGEGGRKKRRRGREGGEEKGGKKEERMRKLDPLHHLGPTALGFT